MSEKKDFWLEPITEKDRTPHACGFCDAAGMKPIQLPMDAVIGVGFGGAGVSCNGHNRWDEQEAEYHNKPLLTVAQAEEMAIQEPDSDWRIYYFAPLSEREYQRQGEKNWVLVKQGDGFA